MASTAQILANQNNALLSTGPKTPEGKSAAARNSTKHGLSGAFRVLPHEDQDEFDILLACLRDELAPANEHESFLVEQMAQARWRSSRIQRIEAAVFDQMLEGDLDAATGADPDRAIAAKLLSGSDRTLATLQRYAAATERSYYKAHTEILRSRQMRNEAKLVADLDAAIVGRAIKAPLPSSRPPASAPSVRNEPTFGPKFPTVPGENLALRL